MMYVKTVTKLHVAIQADGMMYTPVFVCLNEPPEVSVELTAGELEVVVPAFAASLLAPEEVDVDECPL